MTRTRTLDTVQQAYTKLWTAFSDAAQKQNLGAERRVTPSVKNEVPEALSLIFLPGWPYKSTSDQKVVDIAVRVREVFSKDLKRLTRATTQVGYFRRYGDKHGPVSRAILELHYDFETPVQEAHPTFHAQLGTTDWPMEDLKQLGMTAIERGGERHYAKARIPTPFMGFGMALVALAADHLQPRNFRKVIEAAQGPHNGKVEPDCSFLMGCLKGEVPHAHHWYDERYVVHEWQEGKKFKAAIPVLKEEHMGDKKQDVRGKVIASLKVPQAKIRFVDGRPTT